MRASFVLSVLVLAASSLLPEVAAAQPCVPTPEVCDGLDNDCDGAIDEAPLADAPAVLGCWRLPGNCCAAANVSWCPPPGATCNGLGTLLDVCAAGTLTCTGAARWACQGSVAPRPEVCDGADNDCNGVTDEGSAGLGEACTVGVGACQVAGVTACTAAAPGTPVCSAVPGEAVAERCNGIDDDCDGEVDDGFVTGEACSVGVGVCKTLGVTACDGTIAACNATASAPEAAEICDNGEDDDCDGETDEGCVGDGGAPSDGGGGGDDAGSRTDAGTMEPGVADGGRSDADGGRVDLPEATPAETDESDVGAGGSGCGVAADGPARPWQVLALGLTALALSRRVKRS